MEFHQLTCFCAVVETGTISAAARKLNMSQPPVSAQIRSLEAELGVTLFHRGARRITLTEQGSALYRYASEILELEKNAAYDVAALGSGRPVPVRLGLISSCRSGRLTNVFRRFVESHPQTSFKVREGNTFELLDLLRKGRIEMAIIREPFNGDDLIRKPIQTDRIAAYGQAGFFTDTGSSAGESSAEGASVGESSAEGASAGESSAEGASAGESSRSLASLTNKPLILYRRWEAIIRNEFAREGVEPLLFCVCDDARTCVRWAEEGLGIALVPEVICPQSPHVPCPQDPDGLCPQDPDGPCPQDPDDPCPQDPDGLPGSGSPAGKIPAFRCVSLPLPEPNLSTTLTAVVRKGRILSSDTETLFSML